ncbi:MAG: FemAB family PEP-CTERM system-associated protein [Acidobacteria bacterium]|nr:FemAB family PEP-CTERM system-associated protein [Acidobacteriota bacterium]
MTYREVDYVLGSDIQIRSCEEKDQERWDEFVASHPACTNYHRWRWQHVFREVFGWPAIYLLAEKRGRVCGILPLISQRCLLRTYLSSMPHLKGGGIVADTPEIERLLLASAIEQVRQNQDTYLELRQTEAHSLALTRRRDKVGAVLRVEPTDQGRWGRLDKKTRNLVRKSLTCGMTAEFGTTALLTDFYAVYRHNMRDLGSPAYASRFFREIMTQFPHDTRICVVRLERETVAAAFLLGFRGALEVAWASSYRRFLNLKPNMFLYWNILQYAAEQGYQQLDFGRSSRGSGTFQFKLQWGAEANDLHWSYWLNQGASLPSTGDNRMQLAGRLWRRLPLALTNVLGPKLVQHIPGV